MKRTYFFDLKDGVPVRDRLGLEFDTTEAAIEHSKILAREFGRSPARDSDLFVSVINEAGAEIHREQVYPPHLAVNASKVG